jgi:hypothetical protein
MKRSFVFIFIILVATNAFALKSMTEPEMKETTAQMATAAGDLGNLASPVTGIAGEMGPIVAPVPPLMFIYDIVSPHVDSISQLVEMNETAEPVTRIIRVSADLTVFAGLF